MEAVPVGLTNCATPGTCLNFPLPHLQQTGNNNLLLMGCWER